jgi:replicative DNA helicase
MRADQALPVLNPQVETHSVGAEQAVLGALLLEPTAWPRISESLVEADFYLRPHRVLFGAISELLAAGKGVDQFTVSEALKRRRQLELVGGLAAISKLVRETPTAANIEDYAQKVRDCSLRRQLKLIAREIDGEVEEGAEDGATLLARAQGRLLALHAASSTGSGLVSSRELAGELVDDLDRRHDAPRGLEIGLQDFDDLTNGLEPGDLVVIAGRPGMGKTALLVSIAAHVARGRVAAVFSAEMPAQQLMRRCVALIGDIPQGRLRRADQLTDSDWSRIYPAVTTLGELRLWIDETSAPSLQHIRAACLAHKAREGLDLVLIDFVQLIQGAGANRYEQLRDVAYGFKAMAKDLAAPVILLAQLNRSVETREEKRPYLSDLRDSGAIEEAADIVGLLYSEGYYRPDFGMPYVLECRIEKHRNGERGECLWSIAGAHSRVVALNDGARVQYRRLRAERAGARRGRATNDL